jgi:hypothetical protein
MTLDELSVKYGTDKGSLKHNYMPFYEMWLPKNPKKILEIGVLKGESIAMWAEYFPEAEIHGLDLFLDNPQIITEELLMNTERGAQGIVLHQGNQCDYILLDKLRHENFDVIIDDGSHNSRDQMITFFGLFNGGQYYIEDLHCCWQSFYRDGLPESATAYELFNSLHDSDSELKIIREKNIVLIQSS